MLLQNVCSYSSGNMTPYSSAYYSKIIISTAIVIEWSSLTAASPVADKLTTGLSKYNRSHGGHVGYLMMLYKNMLNKTC